jgi:tetratricopeptide (TPR) repeat protein
MHHWLVRIAIPLTFLLVASAPPRHAGAQASPEAEKLFRDGKELMKAGSFAQACDAFESSQKLEPNIAALLSLADCRERNGQLASAWALFLDAARTTRGNKDDARLNATANRRASALEPRLSYLTISVPDDSRVAGLEITRNDVPAEPGTWNRAVPLDGGVYTIQGKAPGHEAWSTRITVAPERDHKTVEVPRFKALRAMARVVEPKLSEPAPPRQGWFTGQRKIAAGVGAAGLIALGVGTALGLQASGTWDDAQARYRSAVAAHADTAPAEKLRRDATSRANQSTVAFGIGAAAVVTGAVLWFLGGPDEAVPVAVSPQPGGADVQLTVRF